MRKGLRDGEIDCAECGFFDSDVTFFTKINERMYCSLHLKEEEGK